MFYHIVLANHFPKHPIHLSCSCLWCTKWRFSHLYFLWLILRLCILHRYVITGWSFSFSSGRQCGCYYYISEKTHQANMVFVEKENRKGGKVSLLVFSRNSLTIRNTWNTSFILEFLVVAVYHKYLNSPLTFSTIISAFNYITMWGQNNYNKSRKGTTFISKFHFSVSTFEYHIKINLTNSCKVWNWSKTIVMIWKLMNYSTMYNAPLYVPNSAHPLSVCFYAQLPPSVHK